MKKYVLDRDKKGRDIMKNKKVNSFGHNLRSTCC